MSQLNKIECEQLSQAEEDVVWDGDLISKVARDNLVQKGLMFKYLGYNGITRKGIEVLNKVKQNR